MIEFVKGFQFVGECPVCKKTWYALGGDGRDGDHEDPWAYLWERFRRHALAAHGMTEESSERMFGSQFLDGLRRYYPENDKHPMCQETANA